MSRAELSIPRTLSAPLPHVLGLCVIAAAGAACAIAPSATLLGAVAVAGVAAVTFVPLPRFASLLLAGTFVVPAVILESRLHGVGAAASLVSGQARVVTALALICVVRFSLEGLSLRVPRQTAAAAATYLGFLVAAVGIGYANQNDYAGQFSDLYRQITYAFALLIGFGVSQAAVSLDRRLALYRALASVGTLAALSSVVYWAWTAGLLGDKLPILNGVFADTRSASSYDPHRSVFPLVQDSPNVGAIAFVLLAAFLVPPLIHAGGKRNARLAVVLSVAVLGAVLSTQSRTGLIALAVAPWPFVLRRHDRRLRRRVIAGVLLVAVLALGGYQAFPHGRDFSNPATLISRQQIWRQAVDRFLDKPLLGHGYHYSANANFVEVAVNPPADGSSPPAEYKSVHNEYLGAVVDGGVVGGVVLAYLLLTLSRTGARLSRRGGIAGAEGAGVSCMLLALLVAMTANAALQSAAVSTLFWLFFGIAAARAEQDPTEAGT